MAISYPAGPASVPADLTQPPVTYRRRVALAMAGLLLFLALYALLTGWLAWTAFRVIADASHGGDDAFWGFIVGGCAAFLTVFMVKGIVFLKHRRSDETEIEVTAADQPQLFQFLHRLAEEAGAPKPHRVFLSPRVNASVSYDLSLLNLIFPSKKNLEIGLGLVNTLSLGELKAVLAHEFGHFTQRSMAVGRWVYVAQQIAGHIVAKRDKLDRFLVQFSHIDLRIGWIGWILRGIVWSIRSLVDTIFSLALRMHRALSREMEMHADLVAVSLTGSDAPIYALHRLRTADDAWDRTMAFAGGELAKGHAIVDLFAVQSRMIERMSELLAEDAYRAAPALPAARPESFRLFRAELAQPPRMWSTHPPNDEREANAKRVYIRAPLDDRRGWLLFKDPDTLRQRISALALGTHEKVAPMSTEQAIAALDAQFSRESLDRRYRGIYLDRPITRDAARAGDLFDASAAGAEQHLGALYPDSLSRDIERLRRIENEKALLEAVKEGVYEAAGGIVRHRGRQLRPRELPKVIEQLDKERATVRRKLADHDRRCRTVHRAAASQLGRGWEDYLCGLTAVLHYAEHNEANVRDANVALQNRVAIATAGGRVNKKDVANVLAAAGILREALLPVYAQRSHLELDETLAQRMGVASWASMLEEFKLGAPTRENLANWLGVVDGWVRAVLGPLGMLRRAALDQLLATEARVAQWAEHAAEPEQAPVASRVPNSYPLLLNGNERLIERKLPWWKRFHTADGIIPATARFLVAASIIGAVLGFGGTVGSATVTIYNGLGRPVIVQAGEQRSRVEAFANVSLTLPAGPLHVTAATTKGQPIESFDAQVAHGFANYVYNVAGAAALIEWTQVYGTAVQRPPNPLGAPRWTETGASVLFTEPPTSISSSSGGGTVRVLTGLSGEGPSRVLGEVPNDTMQAAVIGAHARWDQPFRRYTMHWLQLAHGRSDFQELLAARLAENPGDVLALREEQDGASGAARDSVCAHHKSLADAAPNDATLQYLATRCVADVEERNHAFLALSERWPDNAWLAYAAAYTLAEDARWDAALASLQKAKTEPALSGAVAMDVARLRRMINGADVNLSDLKGLSDELDARMSVEAVTEVEGSPYRAYLELKQGRLPQALARARRSPLQKSLWPLLAASDGADSTWADSAFAVASDSSLGPSARWALLALAERHQRDLTPYAASLRQRDPEGTEPVLHFVDVLRATHDPVAAERALGRVAPGARGLAYSVGTVILGPMAPPAWREGAKRLLFASERPYFQ